MSISYSQAAESVRKVAGFLLELGMKEGDKVAILCENRYEWAIFDLGILSVGAVTVPIYGTLSAQQIKALLDDSGAKTIFVSNVKHLQTVESAKPRGIKHIITLFDHHRYTTFQNVLSAKAMENLPVIAGNKLCSLVYTSGTTGDPKGVMLTHANFLSNIKAVLEVISVNETDTCLSFLPLSHVLERMAGYYLMICCGATIAYSRSAEQLAEDMVLVQPTVMIAVPRLYEKIYANMQKRLESGPKIRKMLFDWAISVGREFSQKKQLGQTSAFLRLRHKLAETLVYSKIKAKTGGKLRFFVSGGAPLQSNLGEFFMWAGLPILEGYGLTETSPVLCVNRLEQLRFGTVGKPLSNVEMKIANDAEILAKGPNITSGYWKKPKETKEAFDKEGFFKTGDLGMFDALGNLVITGRKKDLIVLSNGKKVAPTPIEQSIMKSRYISQVIVYGERKSYLIALVVPNWEALSPLIKKWGLIDMEKPQIATQEKVIDFLLSEVQSHSLEFARFEQIKRIIVLDEEFTQAKGELTPTLKMKRPVIYKNYRHQILKGYEGEK